VRRASSKEARVAYAAATLRIAKFPILCTQHDRLRS
jgi:hypothetical protein